MNKAQTMVYLALVVIRVTPNLLFFSWSGYFPSVDPKYSLFKSFWVTSAPAIWCTGVSFHLGTCCWFIMTNLFSPPSPPRSFSLPSFPFPSWSLPVTLSQVTENLSTSIPSSNQ